MSIGGRGRGEKDRDKNEGLEGDKLNKRCLRDRKGMDLSSRRKPKL